MGFEFNIDPELALQLEKVADYDTIARKMLSDSAPILVSALSNGFRRTINNEVADSVELTTLDKDKDGYYAEVNPTGDNTKGHWMYTSKSKKLAGKRTKLTNAALAAYFEYGTTTMSPKPVIRKSVNEVDSKIQDKLQESYNEVVDIE